VRSPIDALQNAPLLFLLRMGLYRASDDPTTVR
jgi:hypothetical protein